MRLMPKVAVLALTGLVALAGCQMKSKLNDQRTASLERGLLYSFEVPAVNFEQTVTVTFDAGDAPVDVYLALDKDVSMLTDDGKKIAAARAKAEKQTSGSVSLTVPANEQLDVILRTDRPSATVKLKFTN